ncbi:MAG TPA: RNA 3'-terminal phosphate cyclase [Povalibacter sp.]|nr:RNA 3'-terminal phosphate cyclase [Povalibacter sp.]
MIEIDGSRGEGGGQILRSALSLSILTGQPFRIRNIRARREKPGLMRQHLTAVNAAAAISGAKVAGASLGSAELTFAPGKMAGGEYSFAIGTAGSCTLVLQTVLPPLLLAAEPSTIRINGGTHNKGSPPVDFLARAFLPLINRMGPTVTLELVRHGFYPRGGGEIRVHVTPCAKLQPITLTQRGSRMDSYAEAYIAAIPMHVAERELSVVGRSLNWASGQLKLRGLGGEVGPGNALTITLVHEHITEVFTGFGEKNVMAETVAKRAVGEAREYIAGTAAAGIHLADQLLLPMALGGVDAFTTFAPTPHFESNAEVIGIFTDCRIRTEAAGDEVMVTRI